jgi:hypothetical protein
MSGVLWELPAFIYIKTYGLIIRDIMPSCLASLGRHTLVLDDILDPIVMTFLAHDDRDLLVLLF